MLLYVMKILWKLPRDSDDRNRLISIPSRNRLPLITELMPMNTSFLVTMITSQDRIIVAALLHVLILSVLRVIFCYSTHICTLPLYELRIPLCACHVCPYNEYSKDFFLVNIIVQLIKTKFITKTKSGVGVHLRCTR